MKKVYMVESVIGEGTKDDPVRILKEFFNENCNKLGSIDEYKIKKTEEENDRK